MVDKYAPQADRWSETAYADPAAYLKHRAALVISLGPRLAPGDFVLDLACGDGGLAAFLPAQRYRGVDSSQEMVAAAERRGVEAVVGDLNEYLPEARVAATLCYRALYYARDRRDFFRHAATYTDRKLVFDLNPRQYELRSVREDLRAAGFDAFALRPFFVPQTVSLPSPLRLLAVAAERSGPLARLALRVRFTYVCAAFRKT